METDYSGEGSRVNNWFIGGQDRTLGGGRVWRSQPWTKSSGDVTKPWLSDTLTTKPQILNTTRSTLKKQHPRLSDDVYNSLNALDDMLQNYEKGEEEGEDEDDDDESFIEAVHAPKSYVTQVAAMDVIVRNAGKNMLIRRPTSLAPPEDGLMVTYVNHKDFIETRGNQLRSIPTSHSMGDINQRHYGMQNPENEYEYSKDLPYPSSTDHAEKVSNPESGYITNDQDSSIGSHFSKRLLMKINPNHSLSSCTSGLTNASLAEEEEEVINSENPNANGDYGNTAGLTLAASQCWSLGSASGSTVTSQNPYYANSEESVYDVSLPNKSKAKQNEVGRDIEDDRISQSSGAFDTDLDDLQNCENQSNLTYGTAGTVHRISSSGRRSDIVSFVERQTAVDTFTLPSAPPAKANFDIRAMHMQEDLTPSTIRPYDEEIPTHPGFEFPSDPYGQQIEQIVETREKTYEYGEHASSVASNHSSPIYSSVETPVVVESSSGSAFPFPVKLRHVGELSSVRSHSSVYSSKSSRSKLSNNMFSEENSAAIQRELRALPLPPEPPQLNHPSSLQKSSSSSSQLFEDNQPIYMMPTSPVKPLVSAELNNHFGSELLSLESPRVNGDVLISPSPYHTFVPEVHCFPSVSAEPYDESIYYNADQINITSKEPHIVAYTPAFVPVDPDNVSVLEMSSEDSNAIPPLPSFIPPPPPNFIPPPPPVPSFIPPPPPLNNESSERISTYSLPLAWQEDPERTSIDRMSQISDSSEQMSSSFVPSPPAPPPPPPGLPPSLVMGSPPVLAESSPGAEEHSLSSAILAVKLRRTEASDEDSFSTSEDRRSFMRVPADSDPVTNLVAEMFNKGFKLRPTANGQRLRQESDTDPSSDDIYGNSESFLENQNTNAIYNPEIKNPIVKSPPPIKPKPPTAMKSKPLAVETYSTKTDSEGVVPVSPRLGVGFEKSSKINGKGASVPSGTASDVTMLPGYVSIPDDCPPWKRAMLEKKNKQLEEDAKKQELAEEKWKDVPAWKRNLLAEKDKKLQVDKTDETGAIKIEPKWKGQFQCNR